MQRFWSKVDMSGGVDACWPWQASTFISGHGCFSFKGKLRGAHRVSLALSEGLEELPLSEVKALHSCDNPPCCNPKHLRWGSQDDNMQDAKERGRNAHGERQRCAVLTTEAVLNIRARHKKRCPINGQSALAREYGVSQNAIWQVLQGNTWGHV